MVCKSETLGRLICICLVVIGMILCWLPLTGLSVNKINFSNGFVLLALAFALAKVNLVSNVFVIKFIVLLLLFWVYF